MFVPFRKLSTAGRWNGALLVAVVIAMGSTACPAAEPPTLQSAGFRLIAPALAWQGETFSGVVVADTDKGPVPLTEGDQIVFSGQVVQSVKSDGTLTIPPQAIPACGPGQRQGDVPYSATVTRAFGKSLADAGAVVLGRVQIVPRTPEHKPRIARISAIVTGQQPFSVFGQGLDRLQEAALLGDDGSAFALGPSVGSSLHRIYLPRSSSLPPKGTLRFVAWDDEGHRLQSPQTAKNPRLTLDGTRITHKGQPGELRIMSDTSGFVQILGGEPQIKIYHLPFPVKASVQKTAEFLSQEVGNYQVEGRFWNQEDLPAARDARRAAVHIQPIQVTYDAARNVTRAILPVQVTDHMGHPVLETFVQMAAAVPHGLEYAMPVTDERGRAVMNLDLPGEVPAANIQPQILGLPRLTWLPQDHCCDCKSVTYTDDPPINNIAAEGFSASDGTDKLQNLLNGSAEGRRIARSIYSQTTLAGWLRITYKLSPAVAATHGDKGEITITRATSVAIAAPNLSAWKVLYRRGDLVQANEPPATGGDTVQQTKVKCPEEASFKGCEYEVWLGLLLEPGAAPPAQVTVTIADTFDKCPGGASVDRNVNLRWNVAIIPPKLNSATIPPPPKKAAKK